jgi:hypothetical protein
VPNVGSQRIPMLMLHPFISIRIGVSSTNILGMKVFQLLCVHFLFEMATKWWTN